MSRIISNKQPFSKIKIKASFTQNNTPVHLPNRIQYTNSYQKFKQSQPRLPVHTSQPSPTSSQKQFQVRQPRIKHNKLILSQDITGNKDNFLNYRGGSMEAKYRQQNVRTSHKSRDIFSSSIESDENHLQPRCKTAIKELRVLSVRQKSNLSLLTSQENENVQSNMDMISQRSFTKNPKVRNLASVNLGEIIENQRVTLQKALITTNSFLKASRYEKMDFYVNEILEKSLTFALSLQAYIPILGKVRLKDQKPPLKLSLSDSKNVVVQIRIDDTDFKSNSQFNFQNRRSMVLNFPSYAENAYIRIFYQSNEEATSKIKFGIQFANSSQQANIGQAFGMVEPPVTKKNMLKKKIDSIINDPVKAAKVIQKLEQMLELRRQKNTQNKNFIEINQNLVENSESILNSQSLLRKQKFQMNHHYSFKIRTLSQQRDRQDKLFKLNRWEKYKQQRELIKQEKIKLFKQLLRGSAFKSLIILDKSLRQLKDKFQKKLQANAYLQKLVIQIKILTKKLRKYIAKGGKTIEIRTQKFIQREVTFQYQCIAKVVEERSMELVMKFLQDSSNVETMKERMTTFYNKIVGIQRQMRLVLQDNQTNFKDLIKYFEEVRRKLIMALSRHRPYFKLVKSIKDITDEMRNAFLSKFYNKCKAKHFEKFYQFRSQFNNLRKELMIDTAESLSKHYQKAQQFKAWIYNFKEVGLPETLSLEPEEYKFLYKACSQTFRRTTIFLLENPQQLEEHAKIFIFKYLPCQILMAMLVIRCSKLENLDPYYFF